MENEKLAKKERVLVPITYLLSKDNELMTDEEKARYNEAVAKQRERIEERKAKRGGLR